MKVPSELGIATAKQHIEPFSKNVENVHPKAIKTDSFTDLV